MYFPHQIDSYPRKTEYLSQKHTVRSIDNLLDAIQKGILTASTKDRLESLEKDKSELSVQIIKGEMAKPTAIAEYIFGLKETVSTEIPKQF